MMRRPRSTGLVFLVALLAVGTEGRAPAQKPEPLPWVPFPYVHSAHRSGTLFVADADTPQVTDVAIFTHVYGWDPNKGDRHPGDRCPVVPGTVQPYGDLNSLADNLRQHKVSTLNRVSTEACNGPVGFRNDTPEAARVLGKYDVRDRILVDDTTVAFVLQTDDVAPEALARIGRKIEATCQAARRPYQAGARLMQSLTVPPFSQGTAHFPVALTGAVEAIIIFPLCGKHSFLSPVPVGDVWGLTASVGGAPLAMPIEGITTPVTFELHADLLPPAPGHEGPIAGTGSVEVDRPWTTVSPPGAANPHLALAFAPEGTSTVQLAEGCQWKATAQPKMTGYSRGTVALKAPPQGNVRIDCHLEVLLSLRVKTVGPQGHPAQAQVELYHHGKRGDWAVSADGRTSEVNGDQQWASPCPLDPGAYKLRARSLRVPGSRWIEGQPFAVTPAIEATQTMTVE